MQTETADGSSTMLIRQARQASFRALTSEKPVIVLVREGRKAVRNGKNSVKVGEGMVGVLPAYLPLMIENQPAQSGRYIASAIVPDAGVIKSVMREGLDGGNPFLATRLDRTVVAFERAADLLDDPFTPMQLKNNAVREVLLWLGTEGIGFGEERSASFSDMLREKIALEPDMDWRSTIAAQEMAVSEATLRRRLAACGTSFNDLLTDVRMTRALGLLQTTELPINRIALDCGYASASRFAMRFRARFGLAPSEIRGEDKERIGTTFDRMGAVRQLSKK